jgi:predicted nucleic acid-binding protein
MASGCVRSIQAIYPQSTRFDSTATAMNPVPRMPERLVIDASAALAVIRAEPLRAVVRGYVTSHASAGGEVHVPSHFWLEIGNVLARRYRFSTADIVEGVQLLDEFGPRTVELDRTLWLLALDRMERHRLSAYDATYLALAESLEAQLLTLDTGLAAAAGTRAVKLGPHRLAEEPAGYVTREPSAVWAQFGEYLASLREDAAAR